MAFSGKIDDGYRLILGDQGIDAGAIGNITLHEGKARFIFDGLQAFQVTGIGQCIQHYHASIGHMGKPFAHKVTANETGPTGDHNHAIHSLFFLLNFTLNFNLRGNLTDGGDQRNASRIMRTRLILTSFLSATTVNS